MILGIKPFDNSWENSYILFLVIGFRYYARIIVIYSIQESWTNNVMC